MAVLNSASPDFMRDLPTELLHEITGLLDRDALFAVANQCRQLRAVAMGHDSYCFYVSLDVATMYDLPFREDVRAVCGKLSLLTENRLRTRLSLAFHAAGTHAVGVDEDDASHLLEEWGASTASLDDLACLQELRRAVEHAFAHGRITFLRLTTMLLPEMLDLSLGFLSNRAPHLRFCSITMHSGDETEYAGNDEALIWSGLFGGHAPMLRDMQLWGWSLPRSNASAEIPALEHVSKLVVAGNDFGQLDRIAPHFPHLEYLDLLAPSDQVPDSMDSVQFPPSLRVVHVEMLGPEWTTRWSDPWQLAAVISELTPLSTRVVFAMDGRWASVQPTADAFIDELIGRNPCEVVATYKQLQDEVNSRNYWRLKVKLFSQDVDWPRHLELQVRSPHLTLDFLSGISSNLTKMTIPCALLNALYVLAQTSSWDSLRLLRVDVSTGMEEWEQCLAGTKSVVESDGRFIVSSNDQARPTFSVSEEDFIKVTPPTHHRVSEKGTNSAVKRVRIAPYAAFIGRPSARDEEATLKILIFSEPTDRLVPNKRAVSAMFVDWVVEALIVMPPMHRVTLGWHNTYLARGVATSPAPEDTA